MVHGNSRESSFHPAYSMGISHFAFSRSLSSRSWAAARARHPCFHALDREGVRDAAADLDLQLVAVVRAAEDIDAVVAGLRTRGAELVAHLELVPPVI